MKLAFGAWLKRRRRALDLTQQDLASRAFCSVNTIRKIEAGDLVPSKTLALELGRALAVPDAAHQPFVRFARDANATAPEHEFTETSVDASIHIVGDVATERLDESPTPSPTQFHPPAALVSAIGRERDINVIVGILRLPGVRLVTLTGPPGTGKTRLSLEVATELVEKEGPPEFQHGVAFVPLAPISDPAQVPVTIAQILSLREPTPDTLRAFLRAKHLLLILDNFEHLLGAAPLVADLLMAAPRLKILATSREPLHLYGERELPITPLATPPLDPLPPWKELEAYAAVQLFVERAQAVLPSFQLDASNAQAVARVVVALDGLPLAIEMAAARVKWSTPQELLPQLARRLDTLSGKARGLEARQRTLRGAIDWSYNLLDRTERRVLHQLGVFRGGFTHEAAAAVCGTPVAEVLQALVEKSLVKAERAEEGSLRYDLLETIREYALEQLTRKGEHGDALAKHAAYYRGHAHAIARAREYGSLAQAAGTGEWRRFDTRDGENYRLALDWSAGHDRVGAIELASDLHDFWIDRGLAREGRERLLQLLQAVAAPGTGFRREVPAAITAWLILADLATQQGDFAAAHAYAQKVRTLTAQQTNIEPLAKSLQQLGYIALMRGDFWRAEELLLSARAQFQALQLPAHEARVLNDLGLIAKDRGELERAEAYHLTALALRRELNLQADIAQSLFNLAIVAYWRGDYTRAIQVGNEAFKLYVADAGLSAASYVLETIGMAHFKLGQWVEATHALETSLAILRRSDDKRGLALILHALGDVTLAQGAHDAAQPYYREALLCCLQTGEKRRASFCLEGFAATLQRGGEAERAVTLLGAADALRQSTGAILYDAERAAYVEIVQGLHTILSPEEFETAWREGQSLDMPLAIALALQ